MSQSENDPRMLLCMRVGDIKKPVDGSMNSNCQKCESLVWVSAAGMNMLIKEEVEIICNRCGKELAENPENQVSYKAKKEVVEAAFDQILRDAEREGCQPLRLYRFLSLLVRIPVEED